MNPQLLYIYIKDIGRCFDNQEFCFTNDFAVSYSPQSGELKIEKKENCFKDLWGRKISNINIIVGKNGAGKTTLLDLIATTRNDRLRSFPLVKKDEWSEEYHEWFAVYHIDDDMFVIEGYNVKIITNFGNIELMNRTGYGISPEYSIAVKYNFEANSFNSVEFIQFFRPNSDEDYTLDRNMVALYMTNRNRIRWYRSNRLLQNEDFYFGFNRMYLDTPLFANIYKFASEDYKMLEENFSAQNIACTVKWKTEINAMPYLMKSELKEMFDLKIYREDIRWVYFESDIKLPGIWNDRERLDFSTKEKFIIKSLEGYILKIWLDNLKKEYENPSGDKDEAVRRQEIIKIAKEEIEVLEFGIDSYENRKEYLKEIIEILCLVAENVFIPGDENAYYARAIIEFINSAEQVEDECFINPETIAVDLKDGKKESIHRMLQVYDAYPPNDEYNKNDLGNNVYVSFENISTGELEYINGFANLYTAINVAVLNSSFKTILIALDEPDASFHPEWSRRYIDSLCKFLDSFDAGREIRYQLIISTHSPFIVSDVPKEHITCIDIKTVDGVQQRIARKADFGLMSNFYDIIKNDFFIESPIGERANLIFKEIVKSINQLKNADGNKVSAIEARILAIGEEIIRKKLIDLLNKKVSKLHGGERMSRIIRLREELRQLETEGEEGLE